MTKISEGPYLIAIDQGTTSTRTVAFTLTGVPVATHQRAFNQIYPRDGWVEHDPEEIWSTVCETVSAVIADIGGASRAAAIGITNQRETALIWDRTTGQCVGNAIVWQDRRGAERCQDLRRSAIGGEIQKLTGLIPDSYFSATKLEWILNANPHLRDRAERGELAAGTIDSFLLWRLTGGGAEAIHATDATNASRTMIYDIHRQRWDETLLAEFGVPVALLPAVRDTASPFGSTATDLFGASIPVTALVGDQQSALIGQMCFEPGMAKATFGTGAFVLINSGHDAPRSRHKLLTTVGYRIAGAITYAIEGSVFNAGTVVQWLRDEAGFIADARESDAAARHSNRDSVVFVPAFTGLGAPHWDPDARGAIFGLTRDTTKADIVRAGLEAVCFQTADLLDAMTIDAGRTLEVLRVDGGMAANDWMLQSLADLTGVPVERPSYLETTVLGAALMAGVGAGLFSAVSDADQVRSVDRIYTPSESEDWRKSRRELWRRAVGRVLER